MMNRVGLSLNSVRNQSMGFGNNENSNMQKIADFAQTTEEKVLKPAAALGAITIGAAVGAKGGGRITKSLTPMLKTISEGVVKTVIPFVQKHADSKNFIGKGLSKCKGLVNLAKSGTPLETIAEKFAAPFHAIIKGFTALAAGTYVAKKTPQMENALESLVDATAVTGAIGA